MGAKKNCIISAKKSRVMGHISYINRPGGAFCVIFLAFKTSYRMTSYTSGL